MLTRTRNRGCALLALTMFAGCAGAETDPLGGEPDLAEFVRDEPVRGDLFIEFTDARGEPLYPESIEISVDGAESTDVECMTTDEGFCTTWLGGFEALERVTVWANSCGHRFGTALPLGPDVDERAPYQAAVTIVGVSGLCRPSEPAL
ncbi:MAG: hypothetical protein ACRBN8_03945 [Nannocystales bacterium]